jgi:hypothetical protein
MTMMALKWQARSLRRLAAAQKAQLEGLTHARRARRRLDRVVWNAFHHRWWSLLLAIPAFGAPFLPLSWSLSPLRDTKKAQDYLQTLWQVQAAGLALSLAVVIFIFEAVYSTRPRPSLRGLAERISLPVIFYAGLYGLGLTGLVLLGGGQDSRGGWAATWAVVWAALSAVSLIGLFIAVLGQIEPDTLYRRWLDSLRNQANAVVEFDVLRRIAAARLQELCTEVAIDFHPVFGSDSSPHLAAVPARRSGVIHDVNLWRVAKAGRLSTELQVAQAHHNESPTILVMVGARVREGDALMRVARVIHQFSNFPNAFKIRRGDPEAEIRGTLRQVHDEASRLIRERSPGAYSEINEVYEHVLLAFPETWARYQQQFVPGLASGLHLFDWTLLDRVQDNLRDEIEQAVRGGSHEIAEEALNLPIVVAMRATELRATGLSDRMLGLFGFGLHVLVRLPADEYRQRVLGWSLLRLSEHARHVEYSYFRETP